MRVVIVGGGRIAQAAHLPALDRVENVELAAVVDRSLAVAKGVAERWGVEAFTQRLAEIVAATGKILRVANMKRHDPGVIRARRAIAEDLGPVLSFTAWYRNSSPGRTADVFWPKMVTDPAVTSTELGFKSDKKRYWLMTHGSHLWDTIRYVIGDVASVQARWNQVGEDMTWQALAQLGGGGVGTADLTIYEHGEGSEGLHVRCARGSLALRIYNPFIHRAADVDVFTDANHQFQRHPIAYANAFERQLRSFAAAVDAAERNGSGDVDDIWGAGGTVADGLAAVRLLEATRDSAVTGEEVRF